MKRKLLLALCALLIGWSNASAQASYNHTYTEGVTVAAGEDYFLYNIGAGQFLTAGLNYGTRATVDNSGRVLTLAVNGTGYSISTNYVSLNNRTDAKAGYLTTNGYVDTPKNDAAWVFTPVNLAGYTNAYTIKNSDTQFLFFDKDNTDPGCPVNVGNNPGNNYSLWLLIPKSAREDAGDYSHYLINTQMNSAWEFKTWGGSTGWNDNAIYAPGGLVSNRCGEKYHATTDVYQQVKETLPNGRYRISAQGFWRQDGSDAGAYLYANDDKTVLAGFNAHGEGTAANMNGASTSFSAGLYVNSVETFVSNGSLRTGIKVESNSQWVIFDNFVLDYLGQVVKDYAVALPDGGAMEADTWYYFEIAVAGNEYNATATTLGDIICTDDGNTLTSAATGNVTLTATENNFAAKRYYVKSSSAQSLVVEAASYSYSISEASVDITEIQPGNTVTVSFIASTNDPSATLDQNYSGVRFNGAAISVTPTASGFTFTVPTVTANTEYTLVIPAGAIGYDEGSTYNAAQEITLNTPALLDGTYYLYDATSGLFLSSGADYGSRANVDAYGKPINWNNSTKMLAFKNSTGVNFFFDNANHANCWIYTDGNSSRGDNRKFEFVSNGAGKYYLQDFAKAVYLKHDNSVINVPVTDVAEATTWTVLSKAERDAIVAAYPAANKTSVITAAGLSGSTDAAGFETYLSKNYVAKDQTSKVGTAKFAGSRGDWTWNQSRARDGQPAYGTDFCEIFEATGNFSQTISGLDEGIYKVTVNAFERSAGWSVCNDNGAEGYEIVTSYFAANDEKVLLKSWYSQKEGTNNPNDPTQAATAFNNDKYKNEVYVYIPASGELTLKLAKPTYVASSWVLFNNVTLTYYSSTMDPSDVTDLLDKAEEYLEKPMLATLKSAISTAKSALESVSSVANYNALNTALDNSETSIASYANMKTNYIDYIASIKENTNFYSADANTVYENNVTAYNNGTITNADANALATTISRYDSPAQNFLMPVWKIGETAATTAESGFYQNTWSGEGASDGSGFLTPFFEYWVSSGNVLPATTLTGTLAGLTPNASYKVEAWVRVQTTDGQTMADNGVTMKVGTGTPVDVTKGSRIGETTRYIKEYVAYGNADASGNLVVTFTVAASSNVSWLAFKNVNYSTVVPVTITDAGYATFSSASALDLIPANTPDGLEAYYVKSGGVNETYVSLTAIEQTVAANEGILFKGEPNATYYVPVAASGEELDGNQLVAAKGSEVDAGNYVFAFVDDNPSTTAGFYTLASATVVPAGKAYLQKPATPGVKAFLPFDGTATGVEAPEVTEAEEEEILYNTAGVRVGKDYKGIVINQKGEKFLNK